jgi:hypothetical protein
MSQDSPAMMMNYDSLSLNLQIMTKFKSDVHALSICYSMKMNSCNMDNGKLVPTLQKFSSVNELAVPFTHHVCLELLTFAQTWKKKSAETNNKICQF